MRRRCWQRRQRRQWWHHRGLVPGHLSRCMLGERAVLTRRNNFWPLCRSIFGRLWCRSEIENRHFQHGCGRVRGGCFGSGLGCFLLFFIIIIIRLRLYIRYFRLGHICLIVSDFRSLFRRGCLFFGGRLREWLRGLWGPCSRREPVEDEAGGCDERGDPNPAHAGVDEARVSVGDRGGRLSRSRREIIRRSWDYQYYSFNGFSDMNILYYYSQSILLFILEVMRHLTKTSRGNLQTPGYSIYG